MVQHGASPTTGTHAAHAPQVMNARSEVGAHAASHRQYNHCDDAEPFGSSARSLGMLSS